jgi:hypothetical protein
LNSLLPEGVDFSYDTQDIEEDATAATTAKLWIDAYLPLVTTSIDENGNVITAKKPADHVTSNMAEDADEALKEKVNPAKNGRPGNSANYTGTGDRAGGLNSAVTVQGTPILSVKDFLRLLADKGVIPDYLVKDKRIAVQDSEVHLKEYGHPEDEACFEWRNGIIKEIQLPGITLNSADIPDVTKQDDSVDELPEAPKFKIDRNVKREIKGDPIPDAEVERGAAPTKNALKAEMEIWEENPELAPHALTPEEIDGIKLVGKG